MDPLRKSDPEFIGPARLVARLGSGGMGTVYLATIENSSVALKVVKGNFYDDPALKTRFEREISTMRSLRSPFVAKVIDSQVDEDDAWMAVEFINGESLSERVQNRGPIENKEWWTTFFGALIALDEIHSNGVLHRDVKPANMLLSESGPKFVDFGIAQAGEETSLTTTGLLAGSPAWLAPEQLEEHRPTPAADIFSLASTMVFAATGSSPWGSPTGTKVPVIFNRILSDPPRVDELTEAQREVLEPMLEKDPQKRPSAEELVSKFLIGQPSVVKQRIAGWISLYYLGHGVTDLPEKEAAARVLRLLDVADQESRIREAEVAKKKEEAERQDFIRNAEKRAEKLRRVAEKEASDTKLQAEKEASALRDAARQKAEKEASALRDAARKEAEALLARTRRSREEKAPNQNPKIRKPLASISIALVGISVLLVSLGLGLTSVFENSVSTSESATSSEEAAIAEPNMTISEPDSPATMSAVLLPSQSAVITFGTERLFTLQFESDYEIDEWPSLAIVPLSEQYQAEGCPLRGTSMTQDSADPKKYFVSCTFREPGIYAVRATWSGNFPGGTLVHEKINHIYSVEADAACFDQEDIWWRNCIKPVVILPTVSENSDHGLPTDHEKIPGIKTVQTCERLFTRYAPPHDGIAGTFPVRTILGSATTMVSTEWYAKLQLLDTNRDGILCSSTTPDEDSSASSGVESAESSETAVQSTYAANLWPRNGDVFDVGQKIRPSLTFDRVVPFAIGGHPLLKLIPIEGQKFDESGCTDPLGQLMRDGRPPNYTTACSLDTPGRWMLQVSWLPEGGGGGDPFIVREFISSEIVVQ